MVEHVNEAATEAVAATGATGLSLALLGPEVAQFVGPAVAPAFTLGLHRVAAELGARGLGPWNRQRIKTATDYAAETMRSHIGLGHTPRDDLFEDADTRSPAEELLEEVCRIAGAVTDERKVRYLGCLYGNLLFAPEVPPPHMRFLCATFEALTYRQLVALAVLAEAQDAIAMPGYETPTRPPVEGRFAAHFRSIRHASNGDAPAPFLQEGVLSELDDLANRYFIGISSAKPGEERNHEPPINHPHTLWAGEDETPIWQKQFDAVRVTPRGRQLVELASLDDLPDSEIEAFLTESWGTP
jgi:hypothetical protein